MGHSTTIADNERYLWADGLRAIAIILVVARHVYDRSLPSVYASIPEPTGIVDATILGAASLGWVGVTLFFVLSGFLVGGGSLVASAQGRFRPGRFLLRRLIRVFLPAMILLAVYRMYTEGVEPLTLFSRNTLYAFYYRSTIDNFLFLSNYTGRGWLAHYWSLCVEAHFYLLVAVLATWGPRNFDARNVGRGLLIFAVVFFAFKSVMWWIGIDSNFYTFSHWQLDFFAAGAGLRLLTLNKTLAWSWLEWKPLVFLGTISYSIYLVHIPIIEILSPHQALLPWLRQLAPAATFGIQFLAFFVILLIAGYAFYVLVERPAFSIREHVPGAKTRRPVPAE